MSPTTLVPTQLNAKVQEAQGLTLQLRTLVTSPSFRVPYDAGPARALRILEDQYDRIGASLHPPRMPIEGAGRFSRSRHLQTWLAGAFYEARGTLLDRLRRFLPFSPTSERPRLPPKLQNAYDEIDRFSDSIRGNHFDRFRDEITEIWGDSSWFQLFGVRLAAGTIPLERRVPFAWSLAAASMEIAIDIFCQNDRSLTVPQSSRSLHQNFSLARQLFTEADDAEKSGQPPRRMERLFARAQPIIHWHVPRHRS